VAENTELGRVARKYVADLLGKKPKPAVGALGAFRNLLGGA
jgi:hypothetical protein